MVSGSRELSSGRGTTPSVVVRDDPRVKVLEDQLAALQALVAGQQSKTDAVEARVLALETPKPGPG
ncbi:hypothetical protein LCGC14_0458060 [marine sediment metagenome]|uniref:Uncharacterized protein n=1 Tax=marine sediment metagenome TaxID=412755 RepID=A0A0F9VPV2_9ZZZZ